MKEQWLQRHWYLPVTGKTLVPFFLQKKRPEKVFLTLTVNYRKIVKKNKLCHSEQQQTGYLMIYDIWRYLVIGCVVLNIGVFQQTVERVYYILKILCKLKVETFFLDTFITLNVKWVLRLWIYLSRQLNNGGQTPHFFIWFF